jgi:hypothetical protein
MGRLKRLSNLSPLVNTAVPSRPGKARDHDCIPVEASENRRHYNGLARSGWRRGAATPACRAALRASARLSSACLTPFGSGS